MPLRKCATCKGDLPAGATGRAKFCSTTCRTRAHKAKSKAPVPLTIVPRVESPPESAAPAPPSSRLDALESAVVRLVRLLDEADPRSAAPLNKEYRETLRELETVRAEVRASGGAGEREPGTRRAFSAAAI